MSRTMKDSGIDWIGIIPDSWQVVPFRSYAEMRREKNKGEKTRELLALSFALGVTLYRDKVYNMDRVKEDYEDYQIVYENDLVLSPNDIIKGSVYVSKYYGCISPMYLVFSARDKKCHHLPYLSYLLRTQEAGRKFFFIARGLIGDILENGKYVTRRMSVSKQDLLSFKVLLPSFTEQQRIAEFLDRKCAEIDEMIALQEQIIEELKAYKQSVITEAVTKGLNPNVPMKDSGIEWIGDVPEEWEVKELKYSLDGLCDGTHGTFERVDNGELLLSAKNIGDRGIVLGDNESQISHEDYTRIISNGFPSKGDVLLCCVGSIGKCCIFNEEKPIAFQRSVAFLRHNKTMTSEYLMYLLKSNIMQAQYEMCARKSAQSGIYMGVINNFVIVAPHSINEQQAIADYLDKKCGEIDELITIKQQKIESLKEYKKSVIYEYVTGKREV